VTGLGCEECKGFADVIGHRAPQPGEAEPVVPGLGEFPLRFRRFRASELEEMRCWDETAAFREPSPLRAKIDNGGSLGPRRQEAPAQLGQFDASFVSTKNGCGLSRPDVVARLEIGGCYREYDRSADLAESLQIAL
jgi:hypothetical protein